jgi:hypothetical protein
MPCRGVGCEAERKVDAGLWAGEENSRYKIRDRTRVRAAPAEAALMSFLRSVGLGSPPPLPRHRFSERTQGVVRAGAEVNTRRLMNLQRFRLAGRGAASQLCYCRFKFIGTSAHSYLWRRLS